MEYIFIPIVSAVVAGLTLVSGFGLGTLLLPAFAIFFPIEIAIAATAIVHFVNNLFRLALIGRWAVGAVVLRFGLPAIAAAMLGAWLMTTVAVAPALHRYQLGNVQAEVTWLKLIIAAILAGFATLELWPGYHRLVFPRWSLPIGGLLSGFFGGISGLQGALRAPFLMRAGLSHLEYVGTANVISTMVDLARLAVYAVGFWHLAKRPQYELAIDSQMVWIVAIACAAALAGSLVGARIVQKVTLRGVRTTVAALLFVTAAAMAAGLV